MIKDLEKNLQIIKDIIEGKIKYYVLGFKMFEISELSDQISFELIIEKGVVDESYVGSNAKEFFKSKEEAESYLKNEIINGLQKLKRSMEKDEHYNFLGYDIIKSAKEYGVPIEDRVEQSYYYYRDAEIKRKIRGLQYENDENLKEIQKYQKELDYINNTCPLDI